MSQTNWPGTTGFPALPYRSSWGTKGVQLPFATGNGESAATTPAIFWGTGNPNGVVSAKPGDTYYQTTPVNTAILWQKVYGTATNTGWQRMQVECGLYNPATYQVDLSGVADATSQMQQCLTDAVAAGGVMLLGPGAYKCGLLTDTTASRLQIVAMPGAVIHNTGPTWLKVTAPSGGKLGVRLNGLTFSLGNTADMMPVIWLEGSSAGGVVDLDIHDIDYGNCNNLNGDLLWLRACFSGSVGRIWGYHASGMKGIVYTALNYNSGNVRFHDITITDVGVGLQFGRAFNATTNQSLLNQLLCQNIKFVRSAESAGMYNPVTLTAGANAGDTTLTVSSGDATAVAAALSAGTPQFAVCADPTYFGDVIRVTGASGTTISLATAVPNAIANTSIIVIGTLGCVIGANTRGVHFDTPHVESTGVGFVMSSGQSVAIRNALAPVTSTNHSRLAVALNNATFMDIVRPLYSGAGTQTTLLEVINQGTVTDISLVEPVSIVAGSGPANFLLQTGSVVPANRIRFLRNERPGVTQVLTYGATTTAPDESYDLFVLTVTDGNAFTIPNPVNRWTGRRLLFDIYNNSGGAMGTVTFGTLYKLAGSFTAPANGQHRMYEFEDSFLSSNIREIARSVADVGN